MASLAMMGIPCGVETFEPLQPKACARKHGIHSSSNEFKLDGMTHLEVTSGKEFQTVYDVIQWFSHADATIFFEHTDFSSALYNKMIQHFKRLHLTAATQPRSNRFIKSSCRHCGAYVICGYIKYTTAGEAFDDVVKPLARFFYVPGGGNSSAI